FDNYSLKPKPLGQPEIFQGGSSRAARDMAARVSDWYFTNGNTPEGIKAQVDDIRTKAAANNHSVKVGVDLVLAGFLHFQEEVEYFGKRVLPLVRELEAKSLNKQTAAVA
ncbi:MAG: LLM class flavin-dependent oxidoreductase, partial [Pseudomonas sp.]